MATKKPQSQYLQNDETQPNWDAGEAFLASLNKKEEKPEICWHSAYCGRHGD
jgi:hypothetical protein